MVPIVMGRSSPAPSNNSFNQCRNLLAHLRRRVYPINVRVDLDDLGGLEEIEDGVGVQWWGAQVPNVDATLFNDVADEFAHEADLVGGEVSSIEEAREFCANCFGVKSHQAADEEPQVVAAGDAPAHLLYGFFACFGEQHFQCFHVFGGQWPGGA